MDTPVLADQQGLTYISSVRTLDATWKTFQEHWTIGTNGEKESASSVQLARRDDDDNIYR